MCTNLATKIGGATAIQKLWVKLTMGSWYPVGTSIVLVPSIRYLSNNHYFVFIVNVNKTTGWTTPFGYIKLNTKRKKKGINQGRKWEVKKMTKQ